MDSSLYAQQSQSQSQYSSPLYMQHVYPQQQYPVYGIVPPTWTPSPTPYFETPLVRLTVLFTAVRLTQTHCQSIYKAANSDGTKKKKISLMLNSRNTWFYCNLFGMEGFCITSLQETSTCWLINQVCVALIEIIASLQTVK